MTNTRRVSLICSGVILALLAVVAVTVLWPRGTPVKFANVTDTPLKNVEVEFMGELVRFETIAPHSTVFRSIPYRRAIRADAVAKPCPIVRLSFGEGEPLTFRADSRWFLIPIHELNLQLDDPPGSPRIHVEALDRRVIGYRYSSFHMNPHSAKKGSPR